MTTTSAAPLLASTLGQSEPSGEAGQDLTGLSGWVADVAEALGSPGIGLLTFLETVFPPIPSEVILPLGGFLAEQGRISLAGVLVLSTLGSVLGALLLYGAAWYLGEERATRWLAVLPLVDAEDVHAAAGWFHRHGSGAVFFGRLVPGVRSLISLPAGAAHMPPLTFLVLTVLGSGLWNSLLIGGGYALGTQWEQVSQYADWLNYAVYAAIAGVVVWLAVRRYRKVTAARRGGA